MTPGWQRFALGDARITTIYEGTSEIMEEINASISYDQRLYNQDISGSIAHPGMLADAGILTASDVKKIITGPST
mgnify:FL=1